MKEKLVLNVWNIFDLLIILMLIIEAWLTFIRTNPFGDFTVVYVFLVIFATIINAYYRGPNIWRFLSILVAIGIALLIAGISQLIVWPD